MTKMNRENHLPEDSEAQYLSIVRQVIALVRNELAQ